MSDRPTPKSEFVAGMRDTIPLVIGGIPFAIIFGALAVNAGLSPLGAQAMSLLVLAGSAQFIAVGLIAQHASALFVVLTTLVVNLRHALYGATLGPYLRHVPQRWLPLMGFTLTDETFVTVAKRFEERGGLPFGQWYYFGSAVLLCVDWQIWTLVGIVAGRSIPHPERWGLDFAATVTFTGMTVGMVRSRSAIVAVAAAGAVSVMAHSLPNQLGLLLAAGAGITAGVVSQALFRDMGEAPGKGAPVAGGGA